MPRNLIVGHGFDGKTKKQQKRQTAAAEEIDSVELQPLRDKRRGAEEPVQKPGVIYNQIYEDRAPPQFEVPEAIVPQRALEADSPYFRDDLPQAEVTGIYNDAVVEGALNSSKFNQMKKNLEKQKDLYTAEFNLLVRSAKETQIMGGRPRPEKMAKIKALDKEIRSLERQLTMLKRPQGNVTLNAAGELITPAVALPRGHYEYTGRGNSSVKPVLPGAAEEEPDTMQEIAKIKKELKILKKALPQLRDNAFDPKNKSRQSSMKYSQALKRFSRLQDRLDEYTGGIDMEEAD